MSETAQHTDQPGPRRPQDVTVLVVDDEADIAAYLGSVLEDAGMRVVTAHDGEEALAAIERHPPDLISLDLVMPRKSGIRLLAELRRHREWSRIPVVIVTAHARDPLVRSDLDAVLAESTLTGPSVYLEKPVTPRRYLRGICQVLGIEPAAETGGTDTLRQETQRLLDAADESTLQEVLRTLQRTSS